MRIHTSSRLSVLMLALLSGGCGKGSIGSSDKAPQNTPGEFDPANSNDDRPEENEPIDGDDDAPEPTPSTDAGTSEPTPTTDAGAPEPTPTTDASAPEPAPTTDAGAPEPTPTTDAGAPSTPPPPPVTARPHACDDKTTLTDHINCIAARMPTTGSDRYRVPSSAEKTAWRAAVRQMMSGACDFALDSAVSAIARVKTFRDSGNGRTYCVLSEAQASGQSDRGLGTFVVDKSAERELVHAAPHPFTDKNTEKEALEVFRTTKSRAYLLSGSHRDASKTKSGCQSDYYQSDPAHHTDHLFQSVTEELAGVYGDDEWTIIEWHGMREEQCPGENVYMTYGVSGLAPASSALLALRDAIRAQRPTWKVFASDEADCSMAGTSNVQGRWLNHFSSVDVCDTKASSPSGRMIHIEQHPDYRIASDWSIAVAKAFPAAPRHKAAPLAPAGVSISGTTVRFGRVHRATSYTVEDSTRVLATTTSTSATIPAGVTCVTVTAHGAHGKSPRSREVCN